MSNLNFAEIAKKQDSIVLSVIGDKAMKGFEKAYAMSDAIIQLRALLTDEYMKPIMALQSTKLGFKTDKDLQKTPQGYVKGPGYPVEVVRDCLINAVFIGLNPTGNQFNIIGGNMYPTKEGLEFLLNGYPGLKYSIIIRITKVSENKTSAELDAKIKWQINGEDREETIQIPLKIDAYTSVDAMIGKGKRKACAWLLSTLTGESITDGDVNDIPGIENAEVKEISASKPTLSDSEVMEAVIDQMPLEKLQEQYELTDSQIKMFGND